MHTSVQATLKNPLTALCLCLALLSEACLLIQSTPEPMGLQTLHRTTFQHVSDYMYATSIVFADGRRALVADDAWYCQRLYLVNLETNTVTVLTLNSPVTLMSPNFVYAGDAAIAIYVEDKSAPMMKYHTYQVDADGKLTYLAYLEANTATTDEKLRPGDDDLAPYLDAGQLDGLTELQIEDCQWDEAGQIVEVKGISRLHQFYNQSYFVATNMTSFTQALQARALQTITDACALHLPPTAGDVEVRLTRSLTSYLNAPGHIRQADVYVNGQRIKSYSLANATPDFYYWSVITEERLYFVGTSVKYLDLRNLPSP